MVTKFWFYGRKFERKSVRRQVRNDPRSISSALVSRWFRLKNGLFFSKINICVHLVSGFFPVSKKILCMFFSRQPSYSRCKCECLCWSTRLDLRRIGYFLSFPKFSISQNFFSGTEMWMDRLTWTGYSTFKNSPRNSYSVQNLDGNYVDGYVKSYKNLQMWYILRGGHMVRNLRIKNVKVIF